MIKDIRKAFSAALETVLARVVPPAGMTVRVDWENVLSDHTEPGVLYVAPFLLPAPTAFVGMQQTGRLYTGVYQLSVVVPSGLGTEAFDEFVDQILLAPEWTSIRIGNIPMVLTDPPYSAGLLEDTDASRYPITMMYSFCG
mgnify:CR=1 FL=1|jgi:hypothetical protein